MQISYPMHEVRGINGPLWLVLPNKRPVRFSYNPFFSAYFFDRNSIFLSQQISLNSVSACFFSEANGAKKKKTHAKHALGVIFLFDLNIRAKRILHLFFLCPNQTTFHLTFIRFTILCFTHASISYSYIFQFLPLTCLVLTICFSICL